MTMQLNVSFEDNGKGGIYDPYSPTDGEKERNPAGEEVDGEKYDPFDPTGSPQWDVNNMLDREEILEENVEIINDKKEEEPPDSTEILTESSSPSLTIQQLLRRTVESSSKAHWQREGVDSEHSEIEEGEIVGAAERERAKKRPLEGALSPKISFFGSKPERILRVLDGDGFVSVCTEENWENDREIEDEPAIGVEDLRRKLVSRRKERYLSFPVSSPLSSQPPLPTSLPQVSKSPSPVTPPVELTSQNHKSSKSSKDHDRQKSKERKPVEKVVKRKKRRKGKEEDRERSKEKEREQKDRKAFKTRGSSRSSSQKNKRRHSSPEASHHSLRKEASSRRSFSSLSEERHKERERDKDRDRKSHRDSDRDRGRDRDLDRNRHRNRSRSHRKDERVRDSSSRRDRNGERERKSKRYSSSKERGLPKRSKSSREERQSDRDRQHERERRRDGRPVVPPSIQDLNGSDLFAIKRTITVTTTTTTTTVPGSPRLAAKSPCNSKENRKKRKWQLTEDVEDGEGVRSRSRSLSPTRYHGYESDRFSEKLEIDMLSLDGEALDSDYPSLEDTPPAALPLEPPIPSPKAKPSKARQSHPKKKSHTIKKSDASSSSNRATSKCLSSLTVSSDRSSIAPNLSSAKRIRKLGKDKIREKSSRKDLIRSGKSKKETGSSRKGKLQSKVSVLVRDGVSSTTGASVGSGKLSMDLLGPGSTGGGAGGSVVGGSIAVVFCRDNESRSPFLKPCSEPLSLGGRSKDLAGLSKRSSLAGPPSSLTSPAELKSKRTKPSSITSTSSSASSPSSSLATKRRRRLAKKNGKKIATAVLAAGDGSETKSTSEGWGGASFDSPSAIEDRSKSASPQTGQAAPPPCSSSSSSTSSSTSVLPPSSSPPHTPPPSNVPLRDTRESSPDSQTVDSSCKTPEPAFLVEDCPNQKTASPPASSPSRLSTPQGAGLGGTPSAQIVKLPPPEDMPKSLASPPCSSSSAGLTSLSLSLSSTDPSSSSSVSSSSASKLLLPPPPPPAAPSLPWSLQTGVDCTTGGVLALTALLFKMEEANIASRAKAQEFIQATSQILSQANQNQSQHLVPPPSTSSSTQIAPPPTVLPTPGLSPAQFILHSSLPLVGCTKTPPSHLHASLGGGCAQTPPPMLPVGLSGVTGSSVEAGWENENKDSDKYLKKLHTQERAVEEVKLAIKPYYQRKDINKEEYKDILRKAVHKICHSRTGEINPVKVSNLVKLYVQRYKYFRKHGRKMDEEEREDRMQGTLHSSA